MGALWASNEGDRHVPSRMKPGNAPFSGERRQVPCGWRWFGAVEDETASAVSIVSLQPGELVRLAHEA